MIDLFHNRFDFAARGHDEEIHNDGAISTLATLDGTAGDDSLAGTAGDDVFNLQDGGEDTASGGAGSDRFNMGAGFDAGDHIDGGSGAPHDTDAVFLDGDYSSGVAMTAQTLVGVEVLELAGGHDYDLTMNATPADKEFTLEASELGKHDHLDFDGSALDVDRVVVHGGAGADLIMTGVSGDSLVDCGGGADTFLGGASDDRVGVSKEAVSVLGGAGDDYLSVNGALNPDMVLGGGEGDDTLSIAGDKTGGVLVVGPGAITGFETFQLRGGQVAFEDGLDGGSGYFSVSGQTGPSLHFDGSQVSADMSIFGSKFSDTLIGGTGDDTILANKGADTLIGGDGDDVLRGFNKHDKLVGGSGADDLTGRTGGHGAADSFVYLSTSDSNLTGGVDLIHDIRDIDVIDLKAIDADDKKAGNQAFHLVEDFTGHRGELAVHYDSANGRTLVEGDVDGDGSADLTIYLDGKHADFSNFVL